MGQTRAGRGGSIQSLLLLLLLLPVLLHYPRTGTQGTPRAVSARPRHALTLSLTLVVPSQAFCLPLFRGCSPQIERLKSPHRRPGWLSRRIGIRARIRIRRTRRTQLRFAASQLGWQRPPHPPNGCYRLAEQRRRSTEHQLVTEAQSAS